jgi:hypothetical protein
VHQKSGGWEKGIQILMEWDKLARKMSPNVFHYIIDRLGRVAFLPFSKSVYTLLRKSFLDFFTCIP